MWHSFKVTPVVVALGNIIQNHKKMILSKWHSTNGNFGGKVGVWGGEVTLKDLDHRQNKGLNITSMEPRDKLHMG